MNHPNKPTSGILLPVYESIEKAIQEDNSHVLDQFDFHLKNLREMIDNYYKHDFGQLEEK